MMITLNEQELAQQKFELYLVNLKQRVSNEVLFNIELETEVKFQQKTIDILKAQITQLEQAAQLTPNIITPDFKGQVKDK